MSTFNAKFAKGFDAKGRKALPAKSLCVLSVPFAIFALKNATLIFDN